MSGGGKNSMKFLLFFPMMFIVIFRVMSLSLTFAYVHWWMILFLIIALPISIVGIMKFLGWAASYIPTFRKNNPFKIRNKKAIFAAFTSLFTVAIIMDEYSSYFMVTGAVSTCVHMLMIGLLVTLIKYEYLPFKGVLELQAGQKNMPDTTSAGKCFLIFNNSVSLVSSIFFSPICNSGILCR